jgi:hypothetical protein
MSNVTSIVLIIILLLVVYYDFRYMAIPLYLLILAVSISIIRLLLSTDFRHGLSMAGINILGSSMLMLLTFLIVFIYRGKLFNPLNSLLGIGDLVFLPVLCFSFSPLNFIVFFILSLAFILLVKLLIFRSGKIIPLAGSQSVMLIFVIIETVIARFNSYNDILLINLLYS